MTTTQGMFDIDSMIAEVNPAPPLPPYSGRAPLHFTVDYFTPAELAEAFERWCEENDRFGSLRHSHMWTSAVTLGHANSATEGHDLYVVDADLRCWHDGVCPCPGDLVYQAIDVECGWHAIGRESRVVEAWHDHAWPGWRDLPVLKAVESGQDRAKTIAQHVKELDYPTEWMRPGAPIITDRPGGASRHVPGYSPWHGFDLAAPKFHMLRLVTVASPLSKAECFCGLTISDLTHAGAQRQIEAHVNRECIG